MNAHKHAAFTSAHLITTRAAAPHIKWQRLCNWRNVRAERVAIQRSAGARRPYCVAAAAAAPLGRDESGRKGVAAAARGEFALGAADGGGMLAGRDLGGRQPPFQ